MTANRLIFDGLCSILLRVSLYSDKEREELLSFIVKTRRELHAMPELSSKEFRTSEYVAEKLRGWGVSYKRAHTGLIAEIEGTNPEVVALRADFDALPIVENTGLPFASTNGNMHACGHDGHTAMLLGATKFLTEHKPKYTTRLIFQFGEEGDGGATTMIDGGALDGVNAIYALHLCPELQKGKVGTRVGSLFAGVVEFDVEFVGKSAHAATKSEGNDAVASACEFVTLLDLCRHGDENMLLHAGVIKGGQARNIVASACDVECTFRFFDVKQSQTVLAEIGELVNTIGKKYGATGRVTVKCIYPPLINHGSAVNKLRAMTDVVEMPARFTAEDFAYYLEKVEGAMAWLGVRDEEHVFPLHSDRFDFDESVLITGTELFIKLANAGVI